MLRVFSLLTDGDTVAVHVEKDTKEWYNEKPYLRLVSQVLVKNTIRCYSPAY